MSPPARGGDRRPERGQLLLATALVLATLFVVLAVVLNAVIYTENFSTQSDAGREVHEASQVRAAAVEGLEGAVTAANRNDDSYASLHTSVTEEVDGWARLAVRHRVANGQDIELTVRSITDGTLIVQSNESRAFTNVSGADDWELAAGATGVRSFRLSVAVESLVDPVNASSAAELREAGVFHVTVTDTTGDAWSVFVYGDGGANATVRVADPDGTLGPGCSAAAGADGYVDIGLSSGRVAGAPCAELAFLEAVEAPIAVAFASGSNADGHYSLVVAQRESVVDDGDYADSDAGRSPYTAKTLYGVAAELVYATGTVDYRTTLEVEPGGADE